MAALKKSDTGIYSMLSMGRFAGCEGELFRWEAPEGMDFFVGSLNQEKKRAAVAAALTEAVGAESHFEAVMPGQAKKTDSSEADFLSELTATFGQENLMIQEDPKA